MENRQNPARSIGRRLRIREAHFYETRVNPYIFTNYVKTCTQSLRQRLPLMKYQCQGNDF